MTHRSRSWPRAVKVMTAAATMAVAGVAAGCGSDDGGGGGSTAAKQSFSGSPVTVYFSGPLKTPIADTSDAAAAVKAAARTINEAGGLKGHELVVKTCNDTDANAELQCARKAAREGALAFVGSAFIFNPKASQDALAQQHVASVAPLAIQMVEYSSPINFPLQTASFGILACPQQMAQAVGAKRSRRSRRICLCRRSCSRPCRASRLSSESPTGRT